MVQHIQTSTMITNTRKIISAITVKNIYINQNNGYKEDNIFGAKQLSKMAYNHIATQNGATLLT